MALKWISNRTDTTTLFSVDIQVSSQNQTVVEWDTPYIMGIGMLDVYRNGQFIQKDAFEELTNTSIRFLDALREGDIISIRYRPSSISLGSILVKPTYAALLEHNNPLFNTVAIVIQTKRMYLYGHSGWEEFVIPFTTTNVGALLNCETQQVISNEQRSYELENITYQPNMGSLIVFIDGVKVDPSKYTEVNPSTVTFNEDIPVGSSEIEFISISTDVWEDSFSHRTDYSYYSNGNIRTEVVKFGDNTVKQTEYQYDNNGNICREIITKNLKTIIRDYSYDENGNILRINTTVS